MSGFQDGDPKSASVPANSPNRLSAPFHDSKGGRLGHKGSSLAAATLAAREGPEPADELLRRSLEAVIAGTVAAVGTPAAQRLTCLLSYPKEKSTRDS